MIIVVFYNARFFFFFLRSFNSIVAFELVSADNDRFIT